MGTTMEEMKNDCEHVRKELREHTLEYNSQRSTSPWVSQHLEQCLDCRHYQEGLGRAFSLFAKQDFYSPWLRQKTLVRIQNASQAWDLRETLLLVMASVTSVQLSFLLPMWLLSWWMRGLLRSSSLSLGTSFVVVVSLGIVAVLACSLMLWKKGYIQQNGPITGLWEEYHG